VIWQTYHPTTINRYGFMGAADYVRSYFTAATGAIPLLTAFWCSLTGLSGMTGGGDIEEMEDD
jgi:hypothetical protein